MNYIAYLVHGVSVRNVETKHARDVSGYHKMDHKREPYMQLDRLQLRCYLPNEIQNLSILNITETKTFDEVFIYFP